MIRLLISVTLALAVATSAEAMSPAPLHQPNGMITQIRQARQCDDPNQVLVNGICEDYARHVSRAQHKCVAWNEGFCIEYYGTLKPCGPEVRC
jgi:hypothetical protein